MALFDKPWGNYLLENLVESSAPSPISWLPQTIGWRVFITIVVILLLNKAYKKYQSYRKNSYRREALACIGEVREATKNFIADKPLADKTLPINQLMSQYRQLPVLLRQVAIVSFSREEVNHYSGNAWEHWLSQQCNKSNFAQHCPAMLYQLSYWPDSQFIDNDTFKPQVISQIDTLLEQMSLWVKYHRSSHD